MPLFSIVWVLWSSTWTRWRIELNVSLEIPPLRVDSGICIVKPNDGSLRGLLLEGRGMAIRSEALISLSVVSVVLIGDPRVSGFDSLRWMYLVRARPLGGSSLGPFFGFVSGKSTDLPAELRLALPIFVRLFWFFCCSKATDIIWFFNRLSSLSSEKLSCRSSFPSIVVKTDLIDYLWTACSVYNSERSFSSVATWDCNC